MALPTHDSPRLDNALNQVLGPAGRAKNLCTNARTLMLAGPVSTEQIFSLLDAIRALNAQIDAHKATTGLNGYATAQIPGYAGTLTTDIATTQDALAACINWVFTNFPSAGGWLQGHQLNADGTRTPRTFSTAQTVGLQTLLQSVISTIA